MTKAYPKYPYDFQLVRAKICSEQEINRLVELALAHLDENGCGAASTGNTLVFVDGFLRTISIYRLDSQYTLSKKDLKSFHIPERPGQCRAEEAPRS